MGAIVQVHRGGCGGRFLMLLLLLLMIAIFVVHGSIDVNAQCAEGDYRQKMDRKNSWEDTEKFWCTVSPADAGKEKSVRE